MGFRCFQKQYRIIKSCSIREKAGAAHAAEQFETAADQMPADYASSADTFVAGVGERFAFNIPVLFIPFQTESADGLRRFYLSDGVAFEPCCSDGVYGIVIHLYILCKIREQRRAVACGNSVIVEHEMVRSRVGITCKDFTVVFQCITIRIRLDAYGFIAADSADSRLYVRLRHCVMPIFSRSLRMLVSIIHALLCRGHDFDFEVDEFFESFYTVLRTPPD